MLWQKIDADYHERLAKKRELAAAKSRDGVVDRGIGATLNSNPNISQDPEDPAAKVRDCSLCTAPASLVVLCYRQMRAVLARACTDFVVVVQATRAHAAALDDQMGWLHEHEPINVYDEMDWIANRSRAELRGKLRPSAFGFLVLHCLHARCISHSIYWCLSRMLCACSATLEQIIRQERDNLVMKLNSVVQRYTRQVAD